MSAFKLAHWIKVQPLRFHPCPHGLCAPRNQDSQPSGSLGWGGISTGTVSLVASLKEPWPGWPAFLPADCCFTFPGFTLWDPRVLLSGSVQPVMELGRQVCVPRAPIRSATLTTPNTQQSH